MADPTEDSPQWSDAAVAESFRAELRARFEAHNQAYRAKEALELDQVLREHPEYRGQPGFEIRDSGAWDTYQASEIRIDRNAVTIVLPPGTLVDGDLINLFDWTTVSWSRALVGATIVDGSARSTIEILLVATWDAALDAKWRNTGEARRRVIVEIFEEEVLALLALVDTSEIKAEVRQALHDRLKLALEYLP